MQNKKFTKSVALQLLCIFPIVKSILKLVLENWVTNIGSNVIIFGLMMFLIICSGSFIFKMVNVKEILFFCIWTIILLINVFLLEKEKDAYLYLTLSTMIKCYPMYFIGKAIQKKSKTIEKILQACPIVTASIFLFFLFIAGNNIYGNGVIKYSQSLGYSLVMSACIAFFYSLEGKLYQILLAIILLYGILLSGARGPLLCICLAIGFMIINKFAKLSVRNIAIIGISFLIMIVLFINYEAILMFFETTLGENGYNVRSVQLLLSGIFFESGARVALYDAAIKGIIEKPFCGKGIYYSRQYILQYALLSEQKRANGVSTGSYVHNFFLELPLQYGIFIALILIIIFIGLLILNFKICYKDKIKFLIFIMLLARGFFPLLVSGTYVHNEEFYLLIGFMVANIELKRTTKERKYEEKNNS